MGRDIAYASELTDAIRANAAETVRRANSLLDIAAAQGILPGIDFVTKCAVGSGWRPAGVNATTSNAAKGSKHLTGQALDIRDTVPHRPLATWACTPQGRAALEQVGLWCERPQWCPSWLHVQIVPPGSGSRFFVPSSAAPLAYLLPGEGP